MKQDTTITVQEGWLIEWIYGGRQGPYGIAQGEVLETDLYKFGYKDVLRVDGVPGKLADECYIREEDVIRIIEK